MQVNFIKFVALGFITCWLLGCQSKPFSLALEANDQDIKSAEVKLANSADAASQSLQELAAMERAIHPAAKLPNPVNPDKVHMGQLISIDWTGPIGSLIVKIAKVSNYRVRVLGTPPAIPIIVSITTKNTPLADILRNANYQCGQRASIAVYSANRVIELRYAKI